jgi:hypothetical protein
MVLNPDLRPEKRDFEEIKNILFGGSDNAIFYKIVLAFVFKDFGSFEVRRDIEIPKKDDDGVALSFDDGRIAYFKIQSGQLSDEEYESMLDVCYFLQDRFGGSIDAYVLCPPEIEIMPYGGIIRDDVTLRLTALNKYDGVEIVDELETKRRNKERFTFQDCVHHILLPYMGYRDKDVFLPKYQHYMMETMLDNAEQHGIEVFRL